MNPSYGTFIFSAVVGTMTNYSLIEGAVSKYPFKNLYMAWEIKTKPAGRSVHDHSTDLVTESHLLLNSYWLKYRTLTHHDRN